MLLFIIHLDNNLCTAQQSLKTVVTGLYQDLAKFQYGELQYMDATFYNCLRLIQDNGVLTQTVKQIINCIVRRFNICLRDRFPLFHNNVAYMQKGVFRLMCGKFIIDNKMLTENTKGATNEYSWTFKVPRGFYLKFIVESVDIIRFSSQCVTGYILVIDSRDQLTHGQYCGLLNPWKIHLNSEMATLVYKSITVHNYTVHHLVSFTIEAMEIANVFAARYVTVYPAWLPETIDSGNMKIKPPQYFPTEIVNVKKKVTMYYVRTLAGYNCYIKMPEFNRMSIQIADGNTPEAQTYEMQPLFEAETTTHFFCIVVLRHYDYTLDGKIVYYSQQLPMEKTVQVDSTIQNVPFPQMGDRTTVTYRLLTESRSINISFNGGVLSSTSDCSYGSVVINEKSPLGHHYIETFVMCTADGNVFPFYVVTADSILTFYLPWYGKDKVNISGSFNVQEYGCWSINSLIGDLRFITKPARETIMKIHGNIRVTRNCLDEAKELKVNRCRRNNLHVFLSKLSCFVLRSFQIWIGLAFGAPHYENDVFFYSEVSIATINAEDSTNEFQNFSINSFIVQKQQIDAAHVGVRHLWIKNTSSIITHQKHVHDNLVSRTTFDYSVTGLFISLYYNDSIQQHIVTVQQQDNRKMLMPDVRYSLAGLTVHFYDKITYSLYFTPKGNIAEMVTNAENVTIVFEAFIMQRESGHPHHYVVKFKPIRKETKLSLVCYPEVPDMPRYSKCWYHFSNTLYVTMFGCGCPFNCSCDIEFDLRKQHTKMNLKQEYYAMHEKAYQSLIKDPPGTHDMIKKKYTYFDYTLVVRKLTLTWYQAEEWCRKDSSHLVSFANWWELEEVIRLLQFWAHFYNKMGAMGLYIGLMWNEVGLYYSYLF